MTEAREIRRDPRRADLVAGVAALAVIGAVVYLALTAIGGFPWRSTHRISALVPDAQRLKANDEVRIGGVRAGRVKGVEPTEAEGTAVSRIDIEVDSELGPLRADTEITIRPASVLGASYVDLEPGTEGAEIDEGGLLPLENANGTVDLTDLFEIFDRRTGRGMKGTFDSLAIGLGGRGSDLNRTIDSTARLLDPVTRVMRKLTAADTRLPGFIQRYERFITELSGARGRLASLARDGADTFGALVAGDSLEQAIELFPGSASGATMALTVLNPEVERLARLLTELEPAARDIPDSIQALDRAVAAGIEPLEDMPAFARRLQAALETLESVAEAPSTDGAIRKLKDVAVALRPSLEILTPAQVECNTFALFVRNFSKVFDFGIGDGPGFVPFSFVHGGAQGELFQVAEPSPNIAINYYPNSNENECEAGNSLHDAQSQVLGNPPGFQSKLFAPTAPPADSRKRAEEAGLVYLPKDAK